MRGTYGSRPQTQHRLAGRGSQHRHAFAVLTERMVAVSVYHVAARRWAHGWELHITDGHSEIGVTQSRTLASADRMVRDYLALDLGGEPEDFTVIVTPELNDGLAAEAEAARRAVHDAVLAQRDAAARSRAVARRLKAAGLSGADIAVVLKVSTQRVSQLVNS